MHIYNLTKGLTDSGLQLRLHTVETAQSKLVPEDSLKDVEVKRFKRLFDFTGVLNQQPIRKS